MRLLEFEAKRLLAAHGLSVPSGRLWPELPQEVGGYFVKAQIPAGGRGKRGGVLFAATREEAAARARWLTGREIAGHGVSIVYIEARIDIVAEFYLAVSVDRDHRCHTILASRDGGVDIETRSTDRLLKAPVDPLFGLQPFAVRRVLDFLALPPSLHDEGAAAVARLFEVAVKEDATLVEVNPLATATSGRLVAVDAKIILDPNALFRHPEWREATLFRSGSDLETAVAAAGATVVEIDPAGDLVAVVSGAGLMMATLDLLTAGGARVRCMIDLGGTPLADRRRLMPIMGAVAKLDPKVVFINAYFQTALADEFARGIVESLRAVPTAAKFVVRLKGRNGEAARQILEPLGFEIQDGLVNGLDAAIRAGRFASASDYGRPR